MYSLYSSQMVRNVRQISVASDVGLDAYEDRTHGDSGKSKQVGIKETFEQLRCAIPQTGSQAATR
jgi:hypothetical protein